MLDVSEPSRASPGPPKLRGKGWQQASSEHATVPLVASQRTLPALLRCRALYACLCATTRLCASEALLHLPRCRSTIPPRPAAAAVTSLRDTFAVCRAGAAVWALATGADVADTRARRDGPQASADPGIVEQMGAVPLALVAASCLLRLLLECRPVRPYRLTPCCSPEWPGLALVASQLTARARPMT